MTDHSHPQPLIDRLQSVLLRQRLILLFGGLMVTVAAVVAASIGLSLLAGIMILPVWLKISLLTVSGVACLALFIRFALIRLWHGTIDEMAVRLEQQHEDLKGRLIAAIQFSRMKKTPGFSAELMALTQQQALTRSAGLDFSEAVTLGPIMKAARLFGGAAVIAALLLVFSPGMFTHSYNVYSNPMTEIAPPLGYNLVAFPGSTQWIKYRDLEIGAAITGDQFPDEAIIHHRLAGGTWQHTKVDLRTVPRVAGTVGDSLTVTLKLRQVNRSLDYYVEAGRLESEIQKIDVVDRPRVNGIKISIFSPKYTGLAPVVIDEQNGSFSAIVGSRVSLDIECSQPVQNAELVFGDSSRAPLAITGKKAQAAMVISESQSYFVRLTDHLGENNPDPIEYYITAIPDEYPSIDVLSPGFDVNLGDDLRLPMKVRLYDDFGFSSLALKYTIHSQSIKPDENVSIIHFSDRIKTEGDVEFNWDLDQFNMYPGEWVTYYFEIADNDKISGPKVTRSRQYVARIPSLEEIVAEAESESMRRVDRTREVLKQGKDMAERMKNLARKIQSQQKQQKQAPWQQQKELTNLGEQNKELVSNIEKMAEKMEKSIDKLSENSQLSRQILEKMNQIQKLFEEVATPEMKEAQRNLMEALKNMDQDQLKKAMEQFQESMEELLQRLERTLALLKRLQMEQKMETMLRQLEQLTEQQESVNNKTDSSDKKSLPSLSPEERANKASLDDLKKQLSELQKLADEAEMSESPELQEFMEQLEKTDAGENMQQMSDALDNKEKDSASEEGEKALSKLLQMLSEMQEQLAGLQQDSESEKAMRMAMDDANFLSKRQEEMQVEASQLAASSMMLREVAAQQQDLQSSCNGLKNRISELGKQSPFVAAELERLVDHATSCMGQASQEFSTKRRNQGMKLQRDAMADLNLAAIRLMESIKQQSQCNKGGSCDKKMSKLNSQCKKQNQLNKSTKQCNNPKPSSQCNKPGEGNPKESEQGRAALQRLAGQQGAIRKSVEELAKEFGQSRQILGRLDDIAREMQRVEEDLAAGKVGQETIDRQLKIYSRMLQASRSLQRRDFTEQRRAATAEDGLFAPPPQLPAGLLEDRGELEDRLRKYLSEDYPPQYEQQIKAYFKALLQIPEDPKAAGESIQP
jgi:hypothetical protein